MRSEVTAWVAIGANLGDASVQVRRAISDLSELSGVRHFLSSRLYRSAPHQAEGPDFVNAVVRFSTTMHAPALLDALQSLEQAAGRQRPYLMHPERSTLICCFMVKPEWRAPNFLCRIHAGKSVPLFCTLWPMSRPKR